MKNPKDESLFIHSILVLIFSFVTIGQVFCQSILAKDQSTGLQLTELQTQAIFETIELIRNKEAPMDYKLKMGITLLTVEIFNKEPEKTVKVLDLLAVLLQGGKILGLIEGQESYASGSAATNAPNTGSSGETEEVRQFLFKVIRLIETSEQSEMLKEGFPPVKKTDGKQPRGQGRNLRLNKGH